LLNLKPVKSINAFNSTNKGKTKSRILTPLTLLSLKINKELYALIYTNTPNNKAYPIIFRRLFLEILKKMMIENKVAAKVKDQLYKKKKARIYKIAKSGIYTNKLIVMSPKPTHGTIIEGEEYLIELIVTGVPKSF